LTLCLENSFIFNLFYNLKKIKFTECEVNMFDKLAAMAYGLIVFGIIVIIGTVVTVNMSNSVATCSTGFSLNTTPAPVVCYNTTNASQPTATPGGTGFTTGSYLATQFGSSSGGLASWTPALIALGIGLLFLGAFNLGGGKKGRY